MAAFSPLLLIADEIRKYVLRKTVPASTGASRIPTGVSPSSPGMLHGSVRDGKVG
jgi:hypothetical protein